MSKPWQPPKAKRLIVPGDIWVWKNATLPEEEYWMTLEYDEDSEDWIALCLWGQQTGQIEKITVSWKDTPWELA